MNLLKILIFISITFTYAISSDIIKIVYNSNTPPLKFTDKNNQANGMLIDIWKLWAKKTNTKVEFVEASWEDTLKMIKDGEADIHAGLYYTKQRDKYLEYSKTILFNNKKYFFYSDKLEKIEDINKFKPYVVAVDNGYPVSFMKKNYSNLYIKEFPNANLANESFFSDNQKVVLSSLATLYYYIKRNNIDESKFQYSEYTYAYSKQYLGAVKEGNLELLKKIDNGFKLISKEEFDFIELKWTKELDINKVEEETSNSMLSKEQINFLDKKEEISMCVDPNWLPFENIDDGKHMGLVADIFTLFEEKLKYPITLISTKTWSETLNFAKERKCDIISAAALTPERKKHFNFSKPYLRFPQVIVTREKEPFIVDFNDIIHKKIGVVKDSAVVELLLKKYPNINLIEIDDVSEGLYKVSSGELYGFVNTTAAVSYAIAKSGMTNLKIAAKADIDYFLRVAIRNDEPQLVDIFNRVISEVDKVKIEEIKDNWLTVKTQEIVDYSLIYKILGVSIFILGFILYWNRKLKQEINERIIAQEKLNKFMQVIEQSKVSIILTDKSGVIEYVNPFCIKKTGFSHNDFIGSKPSILKSGYQDVSFYDNLWSTILSGKTWSGEFSNKKKNGDVFWESAVIAPIFDNDGKIKYFASIKEDITEKVKVQEELVVAQKEADNANRAKSDFLAKMSHEIRTPMNAVLGMLYLLEKTQLNTTQENYIKKAHGAANSLLGVINDILDFSKIEADKLEIKNEEINIHILINDIMSVMSVKAEENELELLTYYDKEFPIHIISDPLRISQILNNLLSNAIKFTTKGEVLVSTKLVSQNSNEAILKFSVKDTGIGVSKENQKKLFQEFSQVDSSATRSFAGTGLGLAISKKLTNLLGGEIWVEESMEGVGTTICFTIKVKLMNQDSSKNYSLPTNMSNLSVLIVDDNSTACEVLKEMLESFKYSVDVVYNGLDAINIVQKYDYDMVFLDYKMPGLNGIKTYTEYKNILKEKTPKTLLVTAYSQELINESIEDTGIKGYLTKPVSPSTLYDSIINIMNENRIIYDNTKNLKYSNQVLESCDVLLVEDNKLNQEFAISILESFNLIVDLANNGLEAIEKVNSKKYKLVLMDIQMPKLDGLEATRRIRTLDNEYFKNIPIIALSANALVGDKEKSLSAGMNEHITKPINPDELYTTLKKYIKEVDVKIPNGSIQSTDSTKEIIEFEIISKLDKKVLNIDEAMSRMSNNETAYIKILEQFKEHYAEIFVELEKLFVNKDILTLDKKIHELKGISGNLAAKELFYNLLEINSYLQKGKLPTVEIFKATKNSLDDVIKEINKITQKNIIKSKQFDINIVIDLLYNIKNNLNSDIVKCEENMNTLKSYLTEDYLDYSSKLQKALNEFDLDKVDVLIESFLKELNNE